MKKLIITGAIVISSIFSLNTMAQMSEEDAAAAVKRRQSVFQVLSLANGPLGQMARQAVGQIGPKCGACHDRFRAD